MEPKDLYYRIISVANFFLENSTELTIDALKEFDPSVEQLSKTMRVLATILKDLAGDSYEDEDMALNAFQCCLIMEQLADIVASGDSEKLDDLVRKLEMHTKVP